MPTHAPADEHIAGRRRGTYFRMQLGKQAASGTDRSLKSPSIVEIRTDYAPGRSGSLKVVATYNGESVEAPALLSKDGVSHSKTALRLLAKRLRVREGFYEVTCERIEGQGIRAGYVFRCRYLRPAR
jgi:hypothetical protein